MNADNLDSPTESVLGAIFEVSNTLGAGFLEKVYQRAPLGELGLRGIRATAEASFAVTYKGRSVGEYFADLLVEDVPVVELKCVERLASEHTAQCLNYLRASGRTICLLSAEAFGEIVVAALGCQAGRRDSIRGLGGGIGAVGEEQFDEFATAVKRRGVERGEAAGLRGVRVGASGEQQAHHSDIGARQGGVKRGHLLGIGGSRVDIRAAREQIFGQFPVAEEDGQPQAVITVPRELAQERRIGLEQGQGAVAIAGGTGLEEIQLSAVFHKEWNQLRMTVVNRQQHRRDSLRPHGAHEGGVVSQQELGFAAVAALDCVQEQSDGSVARRHSIRCRHIPSN
jgi:GxxExxY protein